MRSLSRKLSTNPHPWRRLFRQGLQKREPRRGERFPLLPFYRRANTTIPSSRHTSVYQSRSVLDGIKRRPGPMVVSASSKAKETAALRVGKRGEQDH